MFNKYQIGEYLYTRLPSYHQIVDEEQNNRVLKKFFEVLNESFRINMEELDKALAMTQASKCAEENLEELAKSLGADWISTIHPKYQRQIISMLIKLYQQKGTVDTIRFIASELSGFEAKIIEGEIPEEYFKPGDEKKRLLTIKLQAPELDDPVTSQQHETTISEVIGKFVPVHTKYVLLVTYFYDEPFYRKFQESNTNYLKQQLGDLYKVWSGSQTVLDVIKYIYDQPTNFQMIGNPDVLGLTSDKKYNLVTNFMTTKTRHDILQYSTLVIKNKESKTILGESLKQEKIKQLSHSEKSTTLDTLHEMEQKTKILNESIFTLPSRGKEEQINATLNQDLGELSLQSNALKVERETNNINTLESKDINLDIKYNKRDKVMIKYMVDSVPTPDLNINTKVLCTGKSGCILSSKEARLSTPSFIDKIHQQGTITILYE